MRNRFSRTGILIVVLLLSSLWINGVSAQDNTPVRDPQALAERYVGFSGAAPTPPLTPIYNVGDVTQFWVGKAGGDAPVRVNASLAAAVPNLYLWVEEGVTITPNLPQTAAQLGVIIDTLRQRDNYRQTVTDPALGTLNNPNDLVPVPDVDNDPHFYVLYTTHLSTDRQAILNPLDSLPVEYAPYSNLHEMLYLDTEPYAGTALDDPLYQTVIVRGIYSWIISASAPQQASWLTETLNWALLYNLQQTKISENSLNAYLQAPDFPLLQPAALTAQAQALGAQQLFLSYFIQRNGVAPLDGLFMGEGGGISPIDAALAQHDVTDPVTGAVVTGRDVFADFVMTNALDIGFGDGRYMQTSLALPQGQTAAATALVPDQPLSGLSVNQFGAQYFRYTAADAQTVILTFTGSPTVARLPMPADRDPEDRYYWSGSATDTDATLTRSVDLSGVDKATLTFDAWYDYVPGWNYGYISVSADNGATWTALPSTDSSPSNQYGVRYGVGFNGISNPAGPHPFPTLGVVISGDGMTVADLVAGGAGEVGGVLRGDIIIGHDNQEWMTAPNILGMLESYAPGDTLHLYIQRAQKKIDVPVILGAHPTRVVEPQPVWQPQTVNLSAYAGKQILLRFESVSLPAQEDGGFAVDNLAIPEISWADSADGSDTGWTENGWESVSNQITQQWIVQTATGGTQTTYPRVRHLITPDSTDKPTIEQKFSLAAGEALIVAISGANDDTEQRATFSLGFQQESMQ